MSIGDVLEGRDNTVKAYKLGPTHPLVNLPLVYLLPVKVIAKFPTLRKLPRCPHEVLTTPEYFEAIKGLAFLNEIMEAVSFLAFPHFGFRGWKEDYSGYFPVWQLSYQLYVFAGKIERITGWGAQALLAFPHDVYIDYPPEEDIAELFSIVVQMVIEENNLQPILEVIREMPCPEDFEPTQSNVRKDFLRKWYHTRSKNVQEISLEQAREDDGHPLFFIPDPAANVEEYVIAKVFVEQFMETLSDKDRKLVALRQAGYTWAEIAEKLGYASHTGVLKRVKYIMKQYREFEDSKKKPNNVRN